MNPDARLHGEGFQSSRPMSMENHSALPLTIPPTEQARPPRAMGFADLLFFYVVTGISLRWIATAASAGPSSLVAWIVLWLCFFVPLALSVLELSARYPEEGGLYVWTKHAFGDFAGFISAWSYWSSNLPYFPAVLYFSASNVLYIRGEHWKYLAESTKFHVWFSIGALALITYLHLVGLRVGKWLHNVGAVGMIVPVVIVVAMGVVAEHRFGSATNFSRSTLIPSSHWKDMVFWSTLAYAFGGCETGSFMGEEVKDAHRTIPRALLLAGIVVTVCYIAGTICVLIALPSETISDLQGLMQAVSQTAGRLGWLWIVPVAATAIAMSNVGAAAGYLASVARLPFVAGIDRSLPPAFGKLHPGWGTPYVALLAQAACSVAVIFLSQAGTSVKGAYDVLVDMAIITYFIPFLFLFASMIRLQREGPELAFRVPGGRPLAIVLGALGFVTTLLMIVLEFVPSPAEPNPALAMAKTLGLTVVLLGTGSLVYWRAIRKSKSASVAPPDPAIAKNRTHAR